VGNHRRSAWHLSFRYSWLSEFAQLVGKNILVKSDPTLHPEQFDIQG